MAIMHDKTRGQFKPSPYQLRSLVLDYLCHHCYPNTARAFARDSTIRHLDADGDELRPTKGSTSNAALSEAVLKDLDVRQQIRMHILSGHVDDATDMLNDNFPSVLSGSTSEHPPQSSDSPSLLLQSMNYMPSTSIDPAHLTLNLRILSFIEACRTIPLVHPAPTNESPSPPPPPTTSTDPPPGSVEHKVALISKAHKLHTLINVLPNPSDRAIFSKELTNVGGLLAYKVPETSPVSKYLSQERRNAVADQINSAILNKSLKPAVSSLELLVRYTSTLWSFAHQHGVKPRPGMPLPLTLMQQMEPSSKPSDKDNEIVPVFDLERFLDSKK